MEPEMKFDREFLHFDNEEICNKFILYIATKNINIIITHRCCSNIGCGIKKNELYDINQIKKDFEKQNIQNIQIYTGLECCVCYNNTAKITKCNHLLCNSCKTQLSKKECPYCRNATF